ncbi:MAG TPA: BON domain-containing protein [Steroidobacteraceae bacterium]|jgi:osmotically-inducible protein OsmY|nr:BON domain-containing protein [Steroidobacteraceae bacterium]
MKTDKQLQHDVIAELSWEPSVNAAHIGVEVSDGVVTLAGHVLNYAEKLNAERAARRVAGVRALAIEMDVKLGGTSKRNDSELASSAEAALQSTTTSPNGVNVKVEGGWITLSGDVEWDYQRQSSVAAVRHLLGVTGISDQILIKPKVSATLVKSDIEAALRRHARDDAQKISVDVQGSDVTLTGSVHSWLERDLARDSAWSTPGVRNVFDKMTVSN